MKAEYFKESFSKIPEEKRKKILDAAITEFADRGFDSANINSIAQTAGVSVGSMYKYFENKEDLFLTIIHFGVETLKSILDEIMQGQEDFLIKIEKIIKTIQSFSKSDEHLTKLYNEMATESNSELVWKLVSDMETVSANMYTSCIKDAQNNGLIRKDIDAGLFAFFLDNLFILLQFSYSCEYYKQRLKIFAGVDILDKDELVVEQLIKFIKGAFLL